MASPQPNDIAGSDKERTVSAYGMDGGFLGGRYDLVIWDDLVDKRSMRTAEARETLINMWETEAETRLEPGGLLILQGQRMRSDDLYRYIWDGPVQAAGIAAAARKASFLKITFEPCRCLSCCAPRALTLAVRKIEADWIVAKPRAQRFSSPRDI